MSELPQQSRRIVWQVRILTFIAVGMVFTTTALVGWALNATRRERAEVTSEQKELDESSHLFQEGAADSRAEILATLDESSQWRPQTNRAVEHFTTFVQAQLASPANATLRPTLAMLHHRSKRLSEIVEDATAWRRAYHAIAADLKGQITLNQARQHVQQLRLDMESVQGIRRLQSAIAFNRWRKAVGEDASQKAKTLLLEQARQQSLGASDLESQLSELARLVEMLGAAEDYDSLTDLRDNKLKPVLDQLAAAVAATRLEGLSSQARDDATIENLRVVLFGKNFRPGKLNSHLDNAEDGLFALRRKALFLRREREILKNTLATLSQELEAVDVSFAHAARLRSAELTRQLEQSLERSWRQMVLFGTAFSGLFLWLAWRITRGIAAQVLVIEQARTTAERSRQTSHQLMQDQQRATAELAAAHESLQASERRFRTLSASAPIGIFLTDQEGQALYLNDHWLQIVGFSLEEMLGQGWAQSLHPDDAADVAAAWQQAVQDGKKFSREFRMRTRNGETRWIWSHAVGIRSEAGAPIGYVGTTLDITARKAAEAELSAMHRKLLDTSRQAGMAEVATSVLHNVGNVLNSVNVASTCVADQLRKSKANNLPRLVALFKEHEADLGAFFTNDPRARQIPSFLAQLVDRLANERTVALEELSQLQKNIDHIKEIVTLQQGYARVSGVTETVQIEELIEDTLRMNSESLDNHHIQVVREFTPVPPVTMERHKVLQILVNLVRNAKHACQATDRPEKTLTVRIFPVEDRLKVMVSDNGVGIPPENLTRVFSHGFTTKADGHGFGLHGGALAAQEMGGTLSVESAGWGHGATFTLDLPLAPAARNLALSKSAV